MNDDEIIYLEELSKGKDADINKLDHISQELFWKHKVKHG